MESLHASNMHRASRVRSAEHPDHGRRRTQRPPRATQRTLTLTLAVAASSSAVAAALAVTL